MTGPFFLVFDCSSAIAMPEGYVLKNSGLGEGEKNEPTSEL
jgi:hypothetical protein